MADELPPPRDLGELLERVRALCAIHHCSVTSGARTEKRNAAVGGHPKSWHRLERGALGVDVVPDTRTPAKRAEVARAARRLGLHAVVESDHVHLQPVAPGQAWP